MLLLGTTYSQSLQRRKQLVLNINSCLIMSSVAKQRLQALSKQLVEGIPDEGTFEDLPKIRHVAADSVGP